MCKNPWLYVFLPTSVATLPPEKLAAKSPHVLSRCLSFVRRYSHVPSYPINELLILMTLLVLGDGRGHSQSPPFPDVSLREAMPRLFTLIHLYPDAQLLNRLGQELQFQIMPTPSEMYIFG